MGKSQRKEVLANTTLDTNGEHKKITGIVITTHTKRKPHPGGLKKCFTEVSNHHGFNRAGQRLLSVMGLVARGARY